MIIKSKIEEELKKRGDFVSIDYLSKILEGKPSTDVKKFIYSKLAEIYEKKKMFNDAAKMMQNIALISIAFSEKIKYYIKETELWIKAGNFEKSEKSMKNAMSQANASQKSEIYFVVKEFYKKQAEIYEKEIKRNHALKIYEKILEMCRTETEKRDIKKKILILYEKLGRIKDYFILKKSLNENI
jgi:tetratricopeptide (TPR) repeat protein